MADRCSPGWVISRFSDQWGLEVFVDFTGLPHVLAEDDEYDGYFIPQGTLVIGNSWYE